MFRTIAARAAITALVIAAASGSASAQTPPNPVLYMTSSAPYTTGAGSFVRYQYDVLNKDQYPAEMFAAAPNLPPCGNNANSSRTWVDIFNARTNQRITASAPWGRRPISAGSGSRCRKGRSRRATSISS